MIRRMDPAPEATIFAVGVSDKVESSLWNAFERDKWAHLDETGHIEARSSDNSLGGTYLH